MSTMKAMVRTLFQHACRFGCEGIVSKRLGSPYRSGRVDDWLKIRKSVGARSQARSGLGQMRPQGSAPDPSSLRRGVQGHPLQVRATEGIIATLVQAPDVFAVVACVSDLHPRTKGTERRENLRR